jgi:hypothetical protein
VQQVAFSDPGFRERWIELEPVVEVVERLLEVCELERPAH